MTSSVRFRLTLAVVLVVGSLTVVAALLAPRSVRSALVDDRLDAEVAAEATALTGGTITVGSDGVVFESPELTALLGPEIANLTAELDGTGVLDEMRTFRDDGLVLVMPFPGVVGELNASGRVRVDDLDSFADHGPIVTVDRLETLASELGVRRPIEFPINLFAQSRSFDDFLDDFDDFDDFDEFPFSLGERLDFGEFDEFPRLDNEIFPAELFEEIQRDLIDGIEVPQVPTAPSRGIDQLVFGTRNVAGVDLIVAAPTDGIDLTVDRLRTALWLTVPVAMLLTGLITWLLAGRALRPVRAITEQTGRIRAGTLHERVPAPSSNDEVAGLAHEMNHMLDRLQRDDERRRQFIADASHELRSPIAAIHTQAEVALAEADDPDSNELASGVLAEAQRLGTIVDDLLSLARHDEALAPPGTTLDLDDIVLAEAQRQRRVPVDTSGLSAGRVRGRSDELTRVVTHLLDNAARHATSTVQVVLEASAETVVLHVDDDGPGVPADARERIFERFVRLDEARIRDDGGAGLGLAVVATVIHALSGSVTVAESPLGGARFSVTLPSAA